MTGNQIANFRSDLHFLGQLPHHFPLWTNATTQIALHLFPYNCTHQDNHSKATPLVPSSTILKWHFKYQIWLLWSPFCHYPIMSYRYATGNSRRSLAVIACGEEPGPKRSTATATYHRQTKAKTKHTHWHLALAKQRGAGMTQSPQKRAS